MPNPDTEIDWQAYMEQVAMFLAGERDYTLIKGGTGPLVYPAAHVYIYSALYYLTDGGRNVLLAQIIFAGVYLGSLSVVMACYRLAKVGTLPPPQPPLSPHPHSVWSIRLNYACSYL